jgi:IS5 family transposase
VPDHSTLARFRSELVRRGLSERLLVELNRQLDARGLPRGRLNSFLYWTRLPPPVVERCA